MKKILVIIVVLYFSFSGFSQNTFPANGNVGIGTTTPLSRLHIGSVQGVIISNGGSSWNNTTLLSTGWIQGIGDFTDIKVPGNQANTANIRMIKNGNVGIGITSPPQALSINGAIGFQSWGNKKLYSPEDGDLEWSTNSGATGHGFAVSHEGDKRVYLATTGPSYFVGGNVGIGTKTPAQTLTVNGGIGFQTWGNKRLYSPEDGDLEWSTNSGAIGHGFAVSHEGDKRVYLATAGPSYFVGGNVGIGTKTPGQTLSVNGGIGFGNIVDKKLYSPADGDLEWSTNSGAIGHGFAVSHEGDKRVYLATTGSSYFVGGNVGIGTKTPGQTLSVNGGIGFGNIVDKKLYSPIDGDLEWSTHSSASGHGFAVSHEGDKRVYLATTGPSYFVGGNVGIGTKTPTEKLEVTGKIKADAIVFPDGSEMTSTLETGTGTNNLWTAGTDLVYYTGKVGIGTTTPAYKLAVKGSIGCSEVQVLDVTGWSDFVFAPNYTLRTLTEVEAFINQNQHLPDVPSEKEVKANGYDVSEMNAILLQKIEELTLYMIEQEKKIEAQDTKIEKVETENAELRAMKSEFENIKELINQMNK